MSSHTPAVALVVFALVGFGTEARAVPVQSVTVGATNNATVQVAGPRTGASGKSFFNMEGSSNGSFSSFGVIDFTVPASGFVPNSLTLGLTQANSGFTTNGGLDFYISSDNATSIDPGTSPLTYMTAFPPTGLDGQLAPLFFLGTAPFVRVGTNGKFDAYTFSLSDGVQSYLASVLSTGGNVRVIVAPDDPTVAATYAGFSNTSVAGPKLNLASVPEPVNVVLLAVAGLGLVGRRAWTRKIT